MMSDQDTGPDTGIDMRAPAQEATPVPRSSVPRSRVPQTRPLIKNHTELGPLFKIVLTNLALTILTLGFYRFWAKTRLRRYLWSHVEIMGDRLEYTGTGKELFLGFLFVFVVILLPLFGCIAALNAVFVDDFEVQQIIGGVQVVLIVFLLGAAFYRARRYRLTRTHWRGIYANQTGSAFKYGLMGLACYVLSLITLGLIWPVCSVWLKKYEMAHTWLGNQQPEFSPQVKKLYVPFMIAWAMLVVYVAAWGSGVYWVFDSTNGFDFNDPENAEKAFNFVMMLIILYFSLISSGLIFMWYCGKAYNHFVSSTRFVNHDVSSTITGGGFVRLTFGNALIMVLSLGLAAPFVYRRYLNFVENRVGLSGDGDFSSLKQSELAKPGTGEGLADAFDVGAI